MSPIAESHSEWLSAFSVHLTLDLSATSVHLAPDELSIRAEKLRARVASFQLSESLQFLCIYTLARDVKGAADKNFGRFVPLRMQLELV